MNALRKFAGDQRGVIADIARMTGVSHAQLSRVAKGQSRPSPDLAMKIEQVTGGKVSAAALLGLSESPDSQPAIELNDGRWTVALDENGQVALPPDMMVSFGFHPGERLVFLPTDEGMRVTSVQKTIAHLQAFFRRTRPGVSLVEELIAERRAEAANE